MTTTQNCEVGTKMDVVTRVGRTGKERKIKTWFAFVQLEGEMVWIGSNWNKIEGAEAELSDLLFHIEDAEMKDETFRKIKELIFNK